MTSNAKTMNQSPSWDPYFTQSVINAIGPKTSPRLREVMTAMIKHVHDFARDVNLTIDEWMQGVELLNEAGRWSTKERNEGRVLQDVLGIESLVDEITHKLEAQTSEMPTDSAGEGPFWKRNAPRRKNGSSIVDSHDGGGEMVFFHGQVLDVDTRKPVANASVDVWQAASNGLYDMQDQHQAENNLRGIFTTDREGRYSFYCLRPTAYPILHDGPAGRLLELLDRHCMRPAHIHFMIQHNRYQPLTTQIFDREGKYLKDDATFCVKDSLLVDFKPIQGNEKASVEVEYNVTLAPRRIRTSKL